MCQQRDVNFNRSESQEGCSAGEPGWLHVGMELGTIVGPCTVPITFTVPRAGSDSNW